MTDKPSGDAVVVKWSPAGRADRRLVFMPDSSGGYTRLTQARRDTDDKPWRTVASERVDSVTVQTP
jgi:hypothetical protein